MRSVPAKTTRRKHYIVRGNRVLTSEEASNVTGGNAHQGRSSGAYTEAPSSARWSADDYRLATGR